MKYFDLVIQTLVLTVTAGISIYHYPSGGWFVDILVGQMILGPWQLVGSFISVVITAPFRKEKLLHLKISATYLLLLLLSTYTSSIIVWHPLAIKLWITIPAWCLGLYYYFITWKWVLPRKHNRSKFLPNLGF